MLRAARVADGGVVYHVLNRANARRTIFAWQGDYELMLSVLSEAHERAAMRMLGCGLMPNHRPLVLWPRRDGDLTRGQGCRSGERTGSSGWPGSRAQTRPSVPAAGQGKPKKVPDPSPP